MSNRNNRNSLIECLTNRRVVVGVFVAIVVLVGLASPVIPQTPTDAVLVLHFDEGSRTIAKDSSDNGNDGAIYGATWVDGKYGKALEFDGKTTYVSIPSFSGFDKTKELTIEAWIKGDFWRDDRDPHFVICLRKSTWDVFRLTIYKTGTLDFVTEQGPEHLFSSIKVPENTWTHIVGVYDKSFKRVYINGIEAGSVAATGNLYSDTGTLYIGDNCGYKDRVFDGIIDEVHVYNRALTTEEIKEHYERKQTTGDWTDWSHSKTVYIKENSGETLADYQVLVDLSGNFPEGANPDGSDIRFVAVNGDELDYWIEEFDPANKTGKIWVKVSEIPVNGETTIMMYYGNPSATCKSNATETLELYDDFSTDTVSGNFERHDLDGCCWGSWSSSNAAAWWDPKGYLSVREQSGCWLSGFKRIGPTSTNVNFTNGYFETKVRSTHHHHGHDGLILAFKDGASCIWFGMCDTSDSINGRYEGCGVGGYGCTQGETFFGKDHTINTNQWYKIGVKKYYDNYTFYFDEDLVWSGNLSCDELNDPRPIGFAIYGNTVSNPGQYDYLLISKYTSPEPTVTFEEVEKKPDLIITDIWWDKENLKIGDEVSFSYTVENKGTADTHNDFGNQLLIDNESWDISARGSLEAGKSKERFFTHVWIAKAGNYTINVVADWEGCINESDDTNNCLTKHLEVVNLDGWVLSDDTSNGVAGVTVTLSPGGMSAITSPNGYYYFTVLPEDDYTITASLEGYTFYSVTCSVYHDATITAPNITGTSDNIITMIDHDRVLIKENTKAEGPNKKVDEYAEVSMYTQRRSSDIIEVYVELNSISVKTDKETGEIVKIEFGEGFNQGAVTLLADENATILWEDRKILVRSEEFIVGSITMNLGYYGDPNVKEPAEKYIVVLPDGTEIDLGYKGGNITPAFYYKYRGDMPYSEWNESYRITSLAQTLPPYSIPYIGPYIGTLFTVDNLLRHFVGVETIAQLLDKNPLELYVENYDEILMTWMGQDPLCPSSHTCDFDAIVMKVPIKIDPYTTHKISVRGKASLYAYSGYEDLVFAKDFEINKNHKLASPVTAGTPMRMDFKSEDESLELLDEEIITNETDEIKFAVMLLSSSKDSKTKYIVVETSQIPTLDEEGNLKADPIMQKGFVSIAIDERAQVDIDSITTKYLVGDDFPCEPPLVLSDPSSYPDMYNSIPELNENNLEVALDILSLIPKFKTLAVPIINIKKLYSSLADSPDDVKQSYANDAEFDVYDIVWCDKSWKILPHNNVVVIIPVKFYSDNSEIAVRAGVSTLYAGKFKRVFIYSKMLDA